ncbi:hypothetical protein KM043_015938 [Ampulex compressa]|nr:hypothetical protein KM043_015938 [Ampulex compressa]
MNLLIISTVSCVLEYIVPVIIKRIVTHLYTGRNYDAELRTDLLCLKQEIAGISMVDEFSRYAKLQRKYNKLEGALKEKVNERLMSKMKMQLSITCAFRIFNGMLICALLYLYNTEPVIVLPKDSWTNLRARRNDIVTN